MWMGTLWTWGSRCACIKCFVGGVLVGLSASINKPSSGRASVTYRLQHTLSRTSRDDSIAEASVMGRGDGS